MSSLKKFLSGGEVEEKMIFREELKTLVDKYSSIHIDDTTVNIIDMMFSVQIWNFLLGLEADLDNLIKSKKGEEPLKPDNFWVLNTPTYEPPFMPLAKPPVIPWHEDKPYDRYPNSVAIYAAPMRPIRRDMTGMLYGAPPMDQGAAFVTTANQQVILDTSIGSVVFDPKTRSFKQYEGPKLPDPTIQPDTISFDQFNQAISNKYNFGVPSGDLGTPTKEGEDK